MQKAESHRRRGRAPCLFPNPLEPLESRRLLASVAWVGDIDANWMTVRSVQTPPFGINTNWSPNVLPGTGDTLVFPAGAASTSNNDFNSASVAGIQVTGLPAGNQRYVIGGNSVTLTGATGLDVTAGVDESGRGPRVSLPLKLAANTAVNVSNPATALELTGAVTGNFSLNKTGAGTLLLTNSGNFFGAPLAVQTVVAGTLRVGDSKAFPGKLALTVNAGATFDLNNLSVQVAHLTFGQGTIKLGSGTLTIGTPFGVIGGADGSTITGTGGITIDYATFQTMNGTTANTYAGATWVKNGALVLAKAPGVVSVPGDLTIGSPAGTSAPDNATVGLDGDAGSDEQIADTATLAIDPGGEFFLASRYETIASLSGGLPGGILHLGFGTLKIQGNQTTTFQGTIDDAGPGKAGTNGGNTLIKSGLGRLTLTADNPYTAVTRILSGALFVNGSQPASPIVLAGGTLGGSGAVGSITAGDSSAVIAPGAALGSTAILRTRDLSLNSQTTVTLDVRGLDPGVDNDQLNVQGAVSLANATLKLDLAAGFAPALSTSFALINNDGADSVRGTFAGLPENARFVISGQTFRITYVGGTGNDVVLIRENGPAVLSAAYNFATAPQFTFAFTQNVRQTLGSADLLIRNLDTGVTLDPATFVQIYDDATNTAAFTHLTGALADGNYRVTLNGAGVANAAGDAIGAVTTLDFFAFAADANHDRTVNFNDLVALAQNYNTSDKTFPQGDFNYDGHVDFNDLVLLAQRYNTTLPLPPVGGVLPAAPLAPQIAAALPALSTVITDDANPKPLFSLVPLRRPAPIKRQDAIKRKN